jgi:hypothetical protein
MLSLDKDSFTSSLRTFCMVFIDIGKTDTLSLLLILLGEVIFSLINSLAKLLIPQGKQLCNIFSNQYIMLNKN